jgi:hypothetical protein
MLKLYLAAHAAAGECVAATNAAEIETKRLEAFKAAGFSASVDYDSFCTFFGDSLVHMRNLAAQKLISERAAEKIK